jgi:hypothetical protein
MQHFEDEYQCTQSNGNIESYILCYRKKRFVLFHHGDIFDFLPLCIRKLRSTLANHF